MLYSFFCTKILNKLLIAILLYFFLTLYRHLISIKFNLPSRHKRHYWRTPCTSPTSYLSHISLFCGRFTPLQQPVLPLATQNDNALWKTALDADHCNGPVPGLMGQNGLDCWPVITSLGLNRVWVAASPL